MSNNAPLNDNLQEIAEMFSEASKMERLDLLLDFSESMPDLPKSMIGDTFEQVHECASPVFLRSRFEDGRVYYDIGVPREAPTVRGFANILREGLNGATPEEIIGTPIDLYVHLGLNGILSHQRLNGLTALLMYMKRQAQQFV